MKHSFIVLSFGIILLFIGCGGGGKSGSFFIDASPQPIACELDGECPSGQHCDTLQNICIENPVCEDHGDCGSGMYCLEQGCLQSEEGSPCATTENCASGFSCNASNVCECTDVSCGACFPTTLTASKVTADVMLAVDRSGSMAEEFLAVGEAITDKITPLQNEMHFGITYFPSPITGSCDVEDPTVDVGGNTTSLIAESFALVDTGGGTPIALTLKTLLDGRHISDASKERSLILISDGSDSCSSGLDPVEEARKLAQTGVTIYAVGFGDSPDIPLLHSIAQQGNTTSAYSSQDAIELSADLDTIFSSIGGCRFDVAGQVTDISELEVKVGGAVIGRDQTHTNGFDYLGGQNQIQLYGQACQLAQLGLSLSAVQGCP